MYLKRQETRDKRQETRDKRQETRDKRQETRDKRQETRDKRQETRDLLVFFVRTLQEKQKSDSKQEITLTGYRNKNSSLKE